MSTLETKVIAAISGSAGGTALATGLLWLLGVLAFGGSSKAGDAANTVAAVPAPVAGVVLLALAALGAGLAGYAAPHTPRPDLLLEPVQVVDPVTPPLPAAETNPIDPALVFADSPVPADTAPAAPVA
jgi:hypothetical protein